MRAQSNVYLCANFQKLAPALTMGRFDMGGDNGRGTAPHNYSNLFECNLTRLMHALWLDSSVYCTDSRV